MARFGLAAWLHNITHFRSASEVDTYADRLARIGYDIFIPCVKNPPGAVDFITDVGDVNPEYPDCDPLMLLIKACQQRGIKVHPWFCLFTEGQNSPLLRRHPEFAASFSKPEPLRWSCACPPEVQDYHFALYKSLTRRYRPDGLHLDYIRTGASCTCDFCRQQMRQRHVDIDSVQLKDPEYEHWVDWRVSRITAFVTRMRDLTRQENLELSAAVFAGYLDAPHTQGQDWVAWARKGLVDFLFPMNYTNSLREAVARAIAHKAWVQHKTTIWQGLGKASSRSSLSTAALIKQMQNLLDVGTQGFVLFHEGAVTEDDTQAIRNLRSAKPTRQPPPCH